MPPPQIPTSSPVPGSPPQNPAHNLIQKLYDEGYSEDEIYGRLSNDSKQMSELYGGDRARLDQDIISVLGPKILAKQAQLKQETQATEKTLPGTALDVGMGMFSSLPRVSRMGNPRAWAPSAVMGLVQGYLGTGAGDVTSPENRGAAAQGFMNLLEQNTSTGRLFAKQNPFLNIAGQSSLSNIASSYDDNASFMQQVATGALLPSILGVGGKIAQNRINRREAAEMAAKTMRDAAAKEARLTKQAEKAATRYKKYLGSTYDIDDMLVRSRDQDKYLGRTIDALESNLKATPQKPLTAGERAMYSRVKGLSKRMGGDDVTRTFAKEIEGQGGSNQYLTKLISNIFEPSGELLDRPPKKELFEKLDKYRTFYEGSGVDMQKVLQDEVVAHFVEQLSDPERNRQASRKLQAIIQRPGLHKDSAAFFTKIFGSTSDPRVRGLHSLANVTDQLSDTFMKMEKAGNAVPAAQKNRLFSAIGGIGSAIGITRGNIDAMITLLRSVDINNPRALKDVNRIIDLFKISAERSFENQNREAKTARTAKVLDQWESAAPSRVPAPAPQIPLR